MTRAAPTNTTTAAATPYHASIRARRAIAATSTARAVSARSKAMIAASVKIAR
jgi:hypothetical protein